MLNAARWPLHQPLARALGAHVTLATPAHLARGDENEKDAACDAQSIQGPMVMSSLANVEAVVLRRMDRDVVSHSCCDVCLDTSIKSQVMRSLANAEANGLVTCLGG